MRTHYSKSFRPMQAAVAACLLSLGLAGCGSGKWGFPYRADIQQGNWITAQQVVQLEAGMSRDQVRYILGTPTLQDAFHADRWDYPFYNQPGYGKDELRRFTVWFDNGRLTRWAGDEQPSRQPFEKADSGAIQTEAREEGREDAEARAATSPDLGAVESIQSESITSELQQGLEN